MQNLDLAILRQKVLSKNQHQHELSDFESDLDIYVDAVISRIECQMDLVEFKDSILNDLLALEKDAANQADEFDKLNLATAYACSNAMWIAYRNVRKIIVEKFDNLTLTPPLRN